MLANRDEIRLNWLPESQRAFRPNASTADNILDVIMELKEKTLLQQTLRNNKIRLKNRTPVYIIAVDFASAFDQ
jgi:hypothetical protein